MRATRGRLAWAHDWVSDPSLNPVFQALPGASFIVNGAVPAHDAALASAGRSCVSPTASRCWASSTSEFAQHTQTYAGTGTVRGTW